jgi:hypothetical protein
VTDEAATSGQAGTGESVVEPLAVTNSEAHATDAVDQDESLEEVISNQGRKRFRGIKRRRQEALKGFSEAASRLYVDQINIYVIDLERFSRLKAKQGSDDGVSSHHVRDAAAFLSTSRVASKLSRYCETVGGILLGAGVAELIVLVQSKKVPPILIAVTAVLIGVGAAMMGIFLGRD